jgi:hypothetical protein
VGTKNSSTSLTTKYQRSLKTSLECIFLTHNANLHKINLEKAFKARRNTLDTREPRTENQSVWTQTCGTINVKPALIRAFTKSVNQDLNIPIRYILKKIQAARMCK